MSILPRSLKSVIVLVPMLCVFSAPARADTELIIQVPGVGTRRALVHAPLGTPPQPWPVVLGFHGGTGNAESFRAITNFNVTADDLGFMIVYMDAGDGTWGDFRPPTGPPDPDLAYTRAVMDHLSAIYPVDERRFYATGLSNGGAFCFVLASELRDRIAAVAPVGHNISAAFLQQATPDGPMHLLQIVGTADPLMPFQGGTQPSGDAVLSSEQTMQYWRSINGNGSVTTQPIPDSQPDGTSAIHNRYAVSLGGFELERIVVINAGHTWPGGLQYLPESVIGLTSRDFSANQMIWDFFEDKRRACDGDFNRSGAVDTADLVALLARFADPAPPGLPQDMNRDGVIDTRDLITFLARFGASCG